MRDLSRLTDRELLREIDRAEWFCEKWHERALRCCYYVPWEIGKTPRGQEAEHLWWMWDTLATRLYDEADRRYGTSPPIVIDYQPDREHGQRGGG
jgi:hypothetical protein